MTNLQLNRLKRIATHALRLGVHGSALSAPAMIRDARTVIELLDLFPLIQKADVISRSAALAKPSRREDEIVLRTSGSSGGVVEIGWRPDDLVSSRRSSARIVARARREAGLRPSPLRPLLAMGASPFHVSTAMYERTAKSDTAMSLRIGLEGDVDTAIRKILAAKPDHLTTYPSIASLLLDQSWDRFPSSVVLGGEHASAALKSSIESRGAVVIDTYGCTEVGMIAVGVGATGELDILRDDVVVERVGIPGSRPGYERIALTSLHNSSCPVLRFVVDDEVHVENCDGTLVAGLRDVRPGVDPTLVRIAGRNVSTRALRGALDSALSRGGYRILVRSDALEISIDREGRGVADQVRDNVLILLAAIGAGDLQVTVQVVDTLAGGKTARRIVMEDTQ